MTVGRVAALTGLLRALLERQYSFITPTPATHARVIGRPDRTLAKDLRDVFGWSLPFAPDLVDPTLLAFLRGAEMLEECEPVYESLPGWADSTVAVTRFEALPKAAQAYLDRMQSVCGVPIDLISTGPDRDQTIVRRHPFA